MKCDVYVFTVNVVIDTEKEVSDAFLSKWLEGACKDYTSYNHTIRINGIEQMWLHDFIKALETL